VNLSLRRRVRPARDEDPLESPFDEDAEEVERCWGYEMPVRHRAARSLDPLP
jgi:hypothetical protein